MRRRYTSSKGQPHAQLLSLTVDTPAEADRLYDRLSDGGEIVMKMETTFFANRFAMLRDRFGVSWMLPQGVRSM